MKIKLPYIIYAVIALFVASRFISINFKGFHFVPKIASAESHDISIYTDQLDSKFSNWSWGSSVNLQDSASPNSGSNAISFTPSTYGALYLHTETALNSNDYDSLQFSIKATQQGQKFAVTLYDDVNQQIQPPISLNDFGGDIDVGNYKQYTIPLTRLNPSNKQIKGFIIQETSGQNQQAIFIDDITLKAKDFTPSATPTTASLTVTPTTDGSTSTPKSTDTVTNQKYIYSDSLGDGFQNWSWSSDIKFDATAHTYNGSKAISYTAHSPWAGLYIYTGNAIDTSDYTALTVAVYATGDNQEFSVVLHDANNNVLGNPVSLKDAGGNLIRDNWRKYTILLSTLSADHKKITGFVLQESSGKSQPTVYVDEISLLTTTTQIQTLSSQTTSSQTTSTQSDASNPFASTQLYIKPDNSAKKTADEWRAAGRTADADQMMKIARNATAFWAVGNDSASSVGNYVTQANDAGAFPVIVAYNIPGRDCGQYSAGGSTADEYKSWIGKIADAIGSKKAAIILEPDALGLDCLQNDTSYTLLRSAIETLTNKPQISVYVEAPTWVPADTMADRLNKINIAKAKGFAINTSGYNTTDSMIQYGNTISSKIGGKHYVIDTSRNGNGPYTGSSDQPWCNPPDRALGNQPTSNTGNALIDAFLWIKVPGESDGTCRGGPSAGTWWPDYAKTLAERAHF